MPKESPLCAEFGERGHEQPCAGCRNRQSIVELGRDDAALRQRVRALETLCAALLTSAQGPQVVEDAEEDERERARL